MSFTSLDNTINNENHELDIEDDKLDGEDNDFLKDNILLTKLFEEDKEEINLKDIRIEEDSIKINENIIKQQEYNDTIKNKTYNYIEVKNYVDDFFNSSIIYKYSCALDILASYLKGQKIIYNESNLLYKYYLNILMISCILLSSVGTVFSQVNIGDNFKSKQVIVIGIINAIITCILSCISYLKLDACCESFKICSNKFEKLEKEIIFLSGEILLFSHPCLEEINYHKNEKIFEKLNNLQPLNNKKEYNKFIFYKQYYKKYNYEELKLIEFLKVKIKEIKKKIIEIEETNNFIIPKIIQNEFSIIYHINVFTIIKKIDDYKTKLIIKLKNIKNNINYNLNKRDDNMENGINDNNESINYLYEKKNKIIEKILFIKTSFLIIDNIFQQEIKNNYIKKQYWLRFFLIRLFGCLIPCNIYPKEYKDPKSIDKKIYRILFEPFIDEDDEIKNDHINNYHL